MLDGHDVHRGVERCVGEGKRGEIGNRVEVAVVPRLVADREIHAAISMLPKTARVPALACACVQHTRGRRQIVRERGDRVFDLDFEVQYVPLQKARQAVGQRGVAHRTRASTITVDPAPHAASTAAKGTAASVSARYTRSFISRAPPPSDSPRTRRAIGSSAGARLLARPAGLSRNEKYFRRTISNPLPASSFSTSESRKSNKWRGTSIPFHALPSSLHCQDAAFGTCTINRPSGASSSRAAAR